MENAPPLCVRRATVADAAMLSRFAASTFADTFGSENTPKDMEMYLGQAFTVDMQRAELADPRTIVFLAERGGELLGYVMLKDGPPPQQPGSSALEIARLYAATHAVGTGIGATLMRRALDEAVQRGHEAVWLGVWERNARAISFYRQWKFEDMGSQTFMLGTDLQTDRVMMRHLQRGG